MKNRLIIATFICGAILFFNSGAYAQRISPNKTGTAVDHEVVNPTKSLANSSVIKKDRVRNPMLKERSYPFADIAFPKGDDPVWQKESGDAKSNAQIIYQYAGQTSNYTPSDCNGIAGLNYYIQTINDTYEIYNKATGANLQSGKLSEFFPASLTGGGADDGDPIILYDEVADRWLFSEFSLGPAYNGPYYMLISISQTGDPLGSWDSYSFPMNEMPDYMKFGIWEDAYYMGTNTSGGSNVYAFQKSAMLSGSASPKYVGFNNTTNPSTIDGFSCLMPLDCDWDYAPANAPGLFIAISDDAWNGVNDELWIYECAVNWTTMTSSTFTRKQQLTVADFDSNFSGGWNNITQKGTSQKVDAIPQVAMFRAQYINFGTYQTIMLCHTVDVNSSDRAGVRWYELRNNSTTWTVRQQGTYSPDVNNRWMGGIAMNKLGEIGLGYSISSSTMFPSIRFAGQSQAANALANNILDIPELTVYDATNSQTSSERWGDYSGMCVDPSNDRQFWFTTQYGGSVQSRIACIFIPGVETVSNLLAQVISSTEIDLSWDLNSNSEPVLVAWSSTGTFGTPVNGVVYTNGQTIPGGGTVLNRGAYTTYNHTLLTPNTLYYYKVWSYNATTNAYTAGVTVNATTLETISVADLMNENKIKIYPNPSNGKFMIEFSSKSIFNVSYEIYTSDGKMVYSNSLKNVSNGLKREIDLSRQKPGVYQMKIQSNETIVNKTLIIK